MSHIYAWLEKLRVASGMDEAAVTLVQAVGEEVQALDAKIFVLDNTRGNLLFFASWSSDAGATLEQKQSIPAWNIEDPLCMALQKGGKVTAAGHPGMPVCPSLVVKGSDRHPEAPLFAYPLLAWNNAAIGGIILRLNSPRRVCDEDVGLLCAYGALLLSAFEQQSRDVARINSLHADVARLECRQAKGKGAGKPLLIGQSAAMGKVLEQIEHAAPYIVSVLLTGETGTGKELAASAIHAASPRADAPFVKINCGALPASLLENELFGHKKGAYSGADSDHIGLLRSAAGGTVLLDEIGEMPLELQVKLLRVLQDREVRPVGDVCSYPVDIRIIAATNKNLEEAVQNGRFRSDLYYRLATYHIHIPALKERREDIPGLAMFFLERFMKQHKAPSAAITHAQMTALCFYDYPGNVRELASLIEHAVISRSPVETHLKIAVPDEHTRSNGNGMTLSECVASFERSIINSAMVCNDGNTTKAARALGIPRTSLLRKIQRNQMKGHIRPN